MHTILCTGKILFEPENKTKKHIAQASWKKVAMVMFDDDIAEYYAWFLRKRFNLELNPPQRGPHITFINDGIDDFNNRLGNLEDKNSAWERIKKKWNGKSINVVLNLRPFSDIEHWWLIVDHKHRDELHSIRTEAGLGRPYFGLHMTFGYQVENKNDKGEKILNRHLEHSKYINHLNEIGLIEMNKDYVLEKSIEIKRIFPERVDLYNSSDELLGTLYNEYELYNVLIQIAKKELAGHYIVWKGKKILIANDGKISDWPEGLYDTKENQLNELMKIWSQKSNTTTLM